jgi:cell pole-organizing protein PopZ
MGDLSAEPSMEDILASIKRVIKEGDGQPAAAPRRGARPAPPPALDDEDEVLELSDPMPGSGAPRREEPARAVERPSPVPAATAPDQPAVSAATVEATRGALSSLSRLLVKPEPESDGTLEGLVRELLRPMLSAWLDQNLPGIVEAAVAREIAKITARG